MKKKLFVCCTMAMAAALLMPTMTSCESFHLQDEQQQEQPAGKAHVKLRFVSASQPSASAKAAAAPRTRYCTTYRQRRNRRTSYRN